MTKKTKSENENDNILGWVIIIAAGILIIGGYNVLFGETASERKCLERAADRGFRGCRVDEVTEPRPGTIFYNVFLTCDVNGWASPYVCEFAAWSKTNMPGRLRKEDELLFTRP